MQEEGNHVIDQEEVGAELQHVHQGPTATTFPSIPVVLELIPKGLPPPSPFRTLPRATIFRCFKGLLIFCLFTSQTFGVQTDVFNSTLSQRGRGNKTITLLHF